MLPPYSPSASTPAYSFSPQVDERRLAIATRSGARGHASRTGAFRFASRRAGVVVKLLNQEEGVTIPIFGRNALIKGTIELEDFENEGVQGAFCVMMRDQVRGSLATSRCGSDAISAQGNPISWRQLWKSLILSSAVEPHVYRKKQ